MSRKLDEPIPGLSATLLFILLVIMTIIAICAWCKVIDERNEKHAIADAYALVKIERDSMRLALNLEQKGGRANEYGSRD